MPEAKSFVSKRFAGLIVVVGCAMFTVLAWSGNTEESQHGILDAAPTILSRCIEN